MKKRVWAIAFSALILAIVLVLYNRTYYINNDNEKIRQSIISFLNRSTVIENDINIKKIVDIDDKKYVLHSMFNSLGYAELKEGLNSRYKIEVDESSDRKVFYRVQQTNKGKYLVVLGENHDMKISYMIATIDAKEYRIEIPKEEYFIKYCSVPKEVQGIIPSILKIYDKDNNEITDKILNEKY
ncbi:MAG: hypothetical protein AB6733_23815 [Clostridiaceae bacterium]